MGKATVIENIGAGRYKIDVDVGSAEKAKVLETLNNARIKLELESFTVYNKLTAKESELEIATENYRVIVVEIEFFYIAKDGQIQALRNDLFSLENEYDTESNKEYTFNLNYNNALFLLNQFKKELNDLTVERDSYVAINNSYRDTIKNFQEEINQRQNSINTLNEDLNIFENILSDKENDLITAKADAESLTQQLEEIANPQTNNYFLSGEAILSLLAETGLFSTITIQDILTDKEAAKTQAKEILRSYYDDRLSSLGFISNVNRTLLSELTPTSPTFTVQNVSFGIVYDVNTKFYDRLAGPVQDDEELIEQLENLRTNGKTISNGAFEALKTTISTKGDIKFNIVSNAMDTMASNKLLVFKDVANYAGIETISNALIENRFSNVQTDILQQELNEVTQVIRVAETAVEVVSSDVESLKNNINILEEEINDLESQLKSVEIQQEDNEFFIYKLNGDGIDFIDNLVESLESENESLNDRIQSNILRIEDLAEDPNNSLEINLIIDENNYLQSQIANNNVRKAFYNGLKPEVLLFIPIPVKEAEIVEQNKLVKDTSRELFGQQLVLADVQKRIDKKMKEINAKETEQAPKALTTKLNALEQILSKVSAEYDALNTEYKYMKLKLAEMARRITYIQGFNGIVSKNAWCVDFTDDIGVNSQVATIEVPGEPQLTLIGPGGPTPTALDGRILARQFQDPNQLYFNAAILPGLLKWRPSYRRGTINSVNYNNNTANVTLAPAEMDSNDYVKLNLNVSTELTNVPITYMSCDGAVFQQGDQVVIKFMGRQWDSPRVVGFVTDPRQCSFNVVVSYRRGANLSEGRIRKVFDWDFASASLTTSSYTTGPFFYSGSIFNRFELKTGETGSKLYLAYYKPQPLRVTSTFSGAIKVFISAGKAFDVFYGGYLGGVSAKRHNGKWYVFVISRSFSWRNFVYRFEMDPTLGVVDTQILDDTEPYWKVDPTSNTTITSGPFTGQKGHQYTPYEFFCEFNESCTIAKQPMYPQSTAIYSVNDPLSGANPSPNRNLTFDALTYTISGISVSKQYQQIGANVTSNTFTPENPVTYVGTPGNPTIITFDYRSITTGSITCHWGYEFVGNTEKVLLLTRSTSSTTIHERYISGYCIDDECFPPVYPPQGGSFAIGVASSDSTDIGTWDYGFGTITASGTSNFTKTTGTTFTNPAIWINYWNPKAGIIFTSERPNSGSISLGGTVVRNSAGIVTKRNGTVVNTTEPFVTSFLGSIVSYAFSNATKDCGVLGKWYGLYMAMYHDNFGSYGTEFYPTIPLNIVEKLKFIDFGNDGITASTIESAFGGFYEPHPFLANRWIRSMGEIAVAFEQ